MSAILSCIHHNKGVRLANEKRRKLDVCNRKLDGATPHYSVSLKYIEEKLNKECSNPISSFHVVFIVDIFVKNCKRHHISMI